MDNRGYAFTPLAVLILIPIILLAVAYGHIVDEANRIIAIAIGGDVTIKVADNIQSYLQKAVKDAGRNAAYNATRKVIDERRFFQPRSYYNDTSTDNSVLYVRKLIVNALNNGTIDLCRKLENETGRQIYINDILVDNYTQAVFDINDVYIYQTDSEPFGFYVHIPSAKIKVVQQNQAFEGYTEPIDVYVSIEGLDDPYIWINTKCRQSNVIWRSPYYSSYFGPGGMIISDYHFDDYVDSAGKLQHLWDYLNGTNNPSNLLNRSRPYYFYDPQGLSFFDRLENKTCPNGKGRISTFILGDPLDYKSKPGVIQIDSSPAISKIDHEYFNGVLGFGVAYDNDANVRFFLLPSGLLPPGYRYVYDPYGYVFCLSSNYKNYFKHLGLP
ncbi:conserved hypothetical protein [Methanothermus fervidus DSM 2088]|uniref:Uncharacterized protein n=1 Tax=Methanothermus fervidus (strain ATCC 43054 / DSM 2088 / JCM 10308 / V24 S) TaxID=523846 RepID=E3GYS9_METFV|nr:hypothetical protein [Methanothermus fervidus]ADP77461.1 conserved hypothetical protein [Methanothermus fervidus DSM 2088]